MLNVGITKSFLLFWNRYDIYYQFYFKVERLIHEMADNPKTGTGHPEPLKGGQSVTYSRRISAHDRIIYDVYDDKLVVLVIKLEGHYDDK